MVTKSCEGENNAPTAQNCNKRIDLFSLSLLSNCNRKRPERTRRTRDVPGHLITWNEAKRSIAHRSRTVKLRGSYEACLGLEVKKQAYGASLRNEA